MSLKIHGSYRLDFRGHATALKFHGMLIFYKNHEKRVFTVFSADSLYSDFLSLQDFRFYIIFWTFFILIFQNSRFSFCKYSIGTTFLELLEKKMHLNFSSVT
jgi:hypothetical protein